MDWRLILAIFCLMGLAAADTHLNTTTKFHLSFSINETFTAALSDRNSNESQSKATSISNAFDPRFKTDFPNFIRMDIIGFSNGSIVVDSTLEFSKNNTIPTTTAIAGSFAVVGNSSIIPNINTNSVNITQVPATTTNTTTTPTTTNSTNTTTATTNSTNTTTTTTNSTNTTTTTTNSTNTTDPTTTNSTNPTTTTTNSTNTTTTTTNSTNTTTTTTNTTTTTSPAVAAACYMTYKTNETFTAALSDPNSAEFNNKATSIRNSMEPIFRKKFKNFLRMIIRAFRSGSIVVDSTLEFSNNGTIPTTSAVATTLVEVANNDSTLKIDTTSVNVTEARVTNTTTTNSTNTTTNTTTCTCPTPDNATANYNLTFSINEAFDSALANSSSPQFIARAAGIRKQVEQVFKKAFPEKFICMEIQKFRSGSIITESKICLKSSGPNVTAAQVQQVFSNGLSDLTFSVDPNSFGISMSPAIAASVSMIWMSLLSLLLTLALHY